MVTRAAKVPKIVPALVARTQFGQILRRAKKNQERFVVDRRGEPQAVIMGIEDYLRNFVKDQPALAAAQQEAKKKGVDRLSLRQINQEIKSYRRSRRRGAH